MSAVKCSMLMMISTFLMNNEYIICYLEWFRLVILMKGEPIYA